MIQFPVVDSAGSVEYHIAGAADRLNGVADRRSIAGFTHYLGVSNDGWLVSDEGLASFAVAAERSLIASIAGSPAWLADLRRVAATYPALPIIVHHLGTARAEEGLDSPGLRNLLAAGVEPNIAVKASGFY